MSKPVFLEDVDFFEFFRTEARRMDGQEDNAGIVDSDALRSMLQRREPAETGEARRQELRAIEEGLLPNGLAFTIKMSNYNERIRNKFGYVNTRQLFELLFTVPLLYHIYRQIDLDALDDSFDKFSSVTDYTHRFEPQYSAHAASRSSSLFASRIASTNPRNEKFYIHLWKTARDSGYTVYLLNVDRAVMDYVYYHYCKTKASFVGVLNSYLDYIGVPSERRPIGVNFMALMDCLTLRNAHRPFRTELEKANGGSPFQTSRFYRLPLDSFSSPCFVQLYMPWRDGGSYFNELIYDYLKREMAGMGACIQENVFTTECSLQTTITMHPPPGVFALPVAMKITRRDGDTCKGVIAIPSRKRKRKAASTGGKSGRNTRARTGTSAAVDAQIDTDRATSDDVDDQIRVRPEEGDEDVHCDLQKLDSRFWKATIDDLFKEMGKEVKQGTNSSIYPAPPVKRLQIFKDPIAVFRMMSRELYKDAMAEAGVAGIRDVKEENHRRFDSFLMSREVRNHLPKGGMQAIFEYSDKRNRIETFPFRIKGGSLLHNAVECLFSLSNDCARASNVIGLFLLAIHQSFICFRLVPMKYHQMITGKQGMGKSHLTELLLAYSIRGLVLLHSQVGSDKVAMTHDPTTHVVEVYAEAGPELTNDDAHSNDAIQQRRANLKNLISSSSVLYSFLDMDKDRKDESARREEQVSSSIHKCLIVCFNRNKGSEPALRDRFFISNHGARVKGADPKSLATAKAGDSEKPEMIELNDQFGSLIQGAQFLSAAYSLFKNTGCSLIDIHGVEECYTPIARLVIYHVLSMCENSGIPVSSTRDAERILLMACSWTKFRVVADYMNRHAGEVMSFGPGCINAAVMRELEIKMVVTLEDVIFAMSLSPPSLFNPTTRAFVIHIRAQRFGLDAMVRDFFELKPTRRNRDEKRSADIQDEDLDYIDYTDEGIVIKKLAAILEDPDGELCVRQLNRGGAVPKKSKKKKAAPVFGASTGENDVDGERDQMAPMLIDPNYIGIKTDLNNLGVSCASTMSIQPSKEDIITSIRQLSETMFVPPNHYKNVVLEPDSNGKFVIVEGSDADGMDASVKLEEAEKKPIPSVIIDRAHGVIYFAFGALCTNKGVNVLLNMVKQEFSYRNTLKRRCVIFDQETLSLKTLDIDKGKKSGVKITLDCAKLSRHTFLRVYKGLSKRKPEATAKTDAWVSLASLGYCVLEEDIDNIAYGDHFENMHLTESETRMFYDFLGRTRSMDLKHAEDEEDDLLLARALDGMADVSEVWRDESEEPMSQTVIPPRVDPKTLFLPIRSVRMFTVPAATDHPEEEIRDEDTNNAENSRRRSERRAIGNNGGGDGEMPLGASLADRQMQREMEEMEESGGELYAPLPGRSSNLASSTSDSASTDEEHARSIMSFGLRKD